jgi:hypothetical protein
MKYMNLKLTNNIFYIFLPVILLGLILSNFCFSRHTAFHNSANRQAYFSDSQMPTEHEESEYCQGYLHNEKHNFIKTASNLKVFNHETFTNETTALKFINNNRIDSKYFNSPINLKTTLEPPNSILRC